MNKTVRNIIGIGLAVTALLIGGTAQAGGYYYKGADAQEALVIRYVPSVATYTGNVTITSTAFTLAGSDVKGSQGIKLTPQLTIADLITAISAVSNTANSKCFSAWKWGSLAADTVSNKFIALSATLLTNEKYTPVAKWDTSVALHYSLVPQVVVGNSAFETSGGVIDHIGGAPDGTGNVAVKVYEDGTAIWSGPTITSPLYLAPQTWKMATNAVNTNATDNAVAISYDVNIPMGGQKVYLIRATRASGGTATTGGISANTK